jgi:hypothetical protein
MVKQHSRLSLVAGRRGYPNHAEGEARTCVAFHLGDCMRPFLREPICECCSLLS